MQERERPCSSRPWPIRRRRVSSESSARNSSRNTWEKYVHPPPLFSRLGPLEQIPPTCTCTNLTSESHWQGPRMVRDVFRMARENAPSIIFIDEVDAIATKRFDAQTGADREVQRILLELLNQMDGFDQGSNVKVSRTACRDVSKRHVFCKTGRADRVRVSSLFLVFFRHLGDHGDQPTRHSGPGTVASRSIG
jgi:hypothetical protein